MVGLQQPTFLPDPFFLTLYLTIFSLPKALILRLLRLSSFGHLTEYSRVNFLAGGSVRRTVESAAHS